jgi:uncharacterized protein
MQCPVCSIELEQVTVGSVQFDVCRSGCGGIFFDNFEIQKVDEPQEEAGELLGAIEGPKKVHRDPVHPLKCPKCEDVVMMKHFSSAKQKVQVDECPSCAGIWIDCGELRQIRSEYKTDAERKQAAEAYFDELFGSALATMNTDREKHLAKVQRFAHLFRFICPSYYIEGKQRWGAF